MYLIEILHQTTTKTTETFKEFVLYLIEILHQTTTLLFRLAWIFRCILSKFYIKPQRLQERPRIFPVVSYRNSTSNHNAVAPLIRSILLYLIEILHQTTTKADDEVFCFGCILSKFYIKPQRVVSARTACAVVSYRNSTSNHNQLGLIFFLNEVVSYRNSTSNHNIFSKPYPVISLYLIEILHQTTTSSPYRGNCWSCILSKFYIKPQHLAARYFGQVVVSYRNSTSNHNSTKST